MSKTAKQLRKELADYKAKGKKNANKGKKGKKSLKGTYADFEVADLKVLCAGRGIKHAPNAKADTLRAKLEAFDTEATPAKVTWDVVEAAIMDGSYGGEKLVLLDYTSSEGDTKRMLAHKYLIPKDRLKKGSDTHGDGTYTKADGTKVKGSWVYGKNQTDVKDIQKLLKKA